MRCFWHRLCSSQSQLLKLYSLLVRCCQAFFFWIFLMNPSQWMTFAWKMVYVFDVLVAFGHASSWHLSKQICCLADHREPVNTISHRPTPIYYQTFILICHSKIYTSVGHDCHGEHTFAIKSPKNKNVKQVLCRFGTLITINPLQSSNDILRI